MTQPQPQQVGGFQPVTPVPTGTSGTDPTLGVFQGYKPPLGPPESIAGPPLPGQTLQQYESFGPRLTELGTTPSKHVYVEGDQWGPVHERPSDIKALQQQLVASGFLDPATVHYGVWDINSADAFKLVLGQANVYGAAAPDMLDALVRNPPEKQKGQKAAYGLTNPLDIANQVSTLNTPNTAQAMIGQNLPAAETQAFTNYYQSQEAQARDAYNKLDLTTQTAYTDKPSLDAAAQAYIKEHNLSQVIAYGTASRMLQFQQMLGAL